jgi:hypothetical protein
LSSSEESRLARAILECLSRHPEDKDTQKGINTWWLQGQRIAHTAQAIFKVLEFLVARAFIIECRWPHSRPYYKINEGQREEIAVPRNV